MDEIKKEDIRVELLNPLHKLDSFACGNRDMNEFLKNDALTGQKLETSKTHLFIHNDRIIGYITTRCDSLKLIPSEKEEHEGLSPKRYKEFPAMKIARLGVEGTLQRQGVGTNILQWGKGFILEKIVPVTGCRFITVDALPEKVLWYEKRGLKKNSHDDYNKKRDTISMRLDLHNPKPLKE